MQFLFGVAKYPLCGIVVIIAERFFFAKGGCLSLEVFMSLATLPAQCTPILGSFYIDTPYLCVAIDADCKQ